MHTIDSLIQEENIGFLDELGYYKKKIVERLIPFSLNRDSEFYKMYKNVRRDIQIERSGPLDQLEHIEDKNN